MEKTLYIIDDHVMVRNGLKSWLEENTDWKITGTASNKTECLNMLNNTESFNHPEIMIVDVCLGDETGYDLIKDITITHPHIKCIMYSMYDSNGYILEAKDCGAKGYISKSASETELAKCLDIISAGGTFVEERMKKAMSSVESILPFLTKQEKRVLEEILKGQSNEEISNTLCLSLHSVENYVSRLYDKIGVTNRLDIIAKFK